MRKAYSFAVLAAAFILAASAPRAGQQTPPAAQPHQHGGMQQSGAPGTQGKMTMDCQQMMQARQKMMDDMKAMDARLDGLVQQMNAATGQAKIDATAAVVNELVTQRKTMREGMEGMHAQMMQHMAEHMQAGNAMKCPMMHEMK